MHPLLTLVLVVAVVALVLVHRAVRTPEPEEAPPLPPPTPRPKPHWLVLVSDDEARSWNIGIRTVVVGRSPANKIQLEGEGVSRSHVEIEGTPDGARLRDLGSANGTAVNGNLVTACDLHDGDVLEIGDVKLAYYAEGDFEGQVRTSLRAADAGYRKTTVGWTAIDARRAAIAEQLYRNHDKDLTAAAEAMGVDEATMKRLLGLDGPEDISRL